MSERTRVVIMGAGGRDFHVFNTCYRDDPGFEVVAFTAAQIPNIADRTYPAVLAGPHYPAGVPIVPEEELEELIRRERVDEVVFAYSDVTWEHVRAAEQRVTGAGARFATFDPERTQLACGKPCVAVCAVRTGCGKSAVSRYVARVLHDAGMKAAVVRHPMPYGELERQVVQRFASFEDLDAHDCTIEEREEYEPHLAEGRVVFAGADYGRILAAAEDEADVILWDGGNNDTPFYEPDLLITLVDPLRPGDELRYFPGQWNLEHADAVVIAKSDEAEAEDLDLVRRNVAAHAPRALVIDGRSPIDVDDPDALAGRRALVVEDGPTTTHGGMGFGAGYLAAKRAGATIVDPRPFARGEVRDAFEMYPHLREVLPALGYGERQLADLAATIDAADCDVVVIGTPIDLSRAIRISKPHVRVTYRFEEEPPYRLAELVRQRVPHEKHTD